MDHFDRDLFQFLLDLAHHNEREWFRANQDRYETWVREPARAFIREVGERLGQVSPHFVASDKKVGGSLMRVHRDVRFSKDKRPYKTNVGIQFRHAVGKDVHAPGFYVHLEAGECFLGAGMWMPDGPSLAKIRERIDTQQGRWADIVAAPEFAAAELRQSGDSLQRAPRGYPKDHPLVEDLKRKSFILVGDLSEDDVITPGFVDRLIERLQATRPYVRFLCDAIEVPF